MPNEDTEPPVSGAEFPTKALLIDESRFTCLAVAKLVSREENLALRYATDMEEALRVADEFVPTVVVRSLQADDPNAIDTIAALRAHNATRDVPIIVLLESQDQELIRRATAAGATACLEKSLDHTALVAAIRAHSRNYLRSLSRQIPGLITSDAATAPARVLMVDDSRTLCVAFGRLIEDTGAAFLACNDPRDALARAREFSPTVILLDLEMPEVTGFDLLPRFKADNSTRDVPVMVLSGISDPEVKARVFHLGADDYAEKQMAEVELLSRIQYHTRAHLNATRLQSTISELVATQKRMEIQRDFIRKTFGRYLSDEVVESILTTPEGLELGGEQREVSIMMADLRGFTSVSERLEPASVLAIVNNFLAVMTDVLVAYNGTIDEFLGDAILAMFGAPAQRDDDAARAVACAVEMQLAMKRVNEWNRRRGFPEVAMGIGINTGEVVVGNIGSERRAKYGVVGRNVNLTSRIESCTVGGQIMISENTAMACGSLLKIDGEMEVVAKGVEQPIRIYKIGGIGGDYDLWLPEAGPHALRTLKKPIDLRLRVLEGKRAGRQRHSGRLVALLGETAEIRTDAPLHLLNDIRVRLCDSEGQELTGELYAKVIERSAAAADIYRIRFTSVPKAAALFLQSYAADS